MTTTRLDLGKLVLRFLDREFDSEANNRVYDWVKLAEAEIFDRVRASWMRTVVRTSVPTEGYIVLPTDWIAPIQVWDTSLSRPLDVLSESQIDMPNARGYHITSMLVPGMGVNPIRIMQFAPTTARNVVVRYWGRGSELVFDLDTNPTLNNCPNLYLYAALRHASVWYTEVPTDKVVAGFEQAVQMVNMAALEEGYGEGFTMVRG